MLTEDKESEEIETDLLVSKHERKVVINDCLTQMLGISLVKVSDDIWRFLDDQPDKERVSYPRTTY